MPVIEAQRASILVPHDHRHISSCAVAPKRLRRFAHSHNDLIWTAADATELDLAAAPNDGSRAMAAASDRHAARQMFQNASVLIE
jgi:hypothetical protein